MVLLPVGSLAQFNIVPMPAELTEKAGIFLLDSKTSLLAYTAGQQQYAAMLNVYLNQAFGFALPIKQKTIPSENYISLSGKHAESNFLNEGYQLTVEKDKIEISAKTNAGTFYAIQTLIQLLQTTLEKSNLKNNQLSVPLVTIKDYPRFAYRGMHLDVARHFQPVAFVKKYIDYLAAYKFNTFHWHLTDDQGWRIEIKKYPRLTEVGGYRNGTIIGRYPGTGNDSLRYGGFYTQAQIKEVVQYASERHIDVIPEIEMPGHASAAIAAYPQLSCFPQQDTKILESTPWVGARKGKQVQQTWGVFEDIFSPTEFTFNFLEDVVDEVMQLFPSKYIHIGGDEAPKEAWKKSPFAQKLIKDKKLKDEHGLQSYFIQRMEKYINKKGRKIIGWDEILEGGLAPNATVMSWRGEGGGIEAAKQNHEVIMTPGGWMYFDHSQSSNEDSVTIGGYTPLEKVYEYEPIPAALPSDKEKYVLGAQANVWTEYLKYPSTIEYMIFPRMAALSEVLWSPKANRNWNSFEERLPAIVARLDKQKINYSKAFYELKATLLPTENYEGLLWKLESKINEPIQINFNGADSVWIYTQAQLISPKVKSATARFMGTTLSQGFSFNKATGKKIKLTTEASKGFPGDGAFTLVNGVQNNKGLTRSREFLGFAGKDLEAVIDLEKNQPIQQIVFHGLEQKGSWIYRPSAVYFYSSPDGINFTLLEKIASVSDKRHLSYTSNKKTTARFVKVVAKNLGTIPTGQPGSGNAAWLFADEIEIN